jgi:UDP-4-amino-4-deoxy-L-arabinose-oxoglutarate aminotransferase
MISHSKPFITESDQMAVKNQLSSGQLAEGSGVRSFEQAVAKYLDIKYCVATSSGVTALDLALSALDLKGGDEVIIPDYLCDSVYRTIKNYGAVPVLCDISDEWNMTPETVAKVTSARTKAIVLVHMFGINSWREEYRKFGLPIIEDNCQAFGLEVNGKLQALKGDIAIYSFHATKCLATGEGGLLSTNNAEYYNKAVAQKKLQQPFCRMTDLQAALGISQLSKYDEMKNRRKKIANAYFDSLPAEYLEKVSKVRASSIFFRFPLNINTPVSEAIEYFGKKKIAVRRGVDALLHEAFTGYGDDFPHSISTFNSTLSIPIYPALSDTEIEIIINEVNSFHNARR